MGAAALPVLIGTAVVGAGMSAVAARNQGIAEQQQAAFQARVAENNRIIAERASQDAIREGDIAAQRHDRSTSAVIGAGRASAAARGVDVNTGSQVDIAESVRKVGLEERTDIRHAARIKAFELQQQGREFGQEADLHRAGGDFARQKGALEATTSIVNGAGVVAGRWKT